MPAFEMFNCVMGQCMLLLDGVYGYGSAVDGECHTNQI